MMTPELEKKALRASAKERRASAHAKHGDVAGEQLASISLDFCGAKPTVVVSGFSAIGDEIDVRPLMLALHSQGFQLALPVIAGKGQPLVMRAWKPGDSVAEKTWGIAEPLDSAPEVEPDILLVPLLAFDGDGYRLGYGGGFYDRTLAKLKARKSVIAVGVAYDEQRVDVVPREGYDEPCDWILTPSGPKRCKSSE
ncbi:MAG: 5-formyltetrahydrofolate cyclo-ligase [Filomicrobium sp.]